MTVLAWDGVSLAADKLACAGNMRATVTKIARCGNELIGICGALPLGNLLRNWYLNGADPDMFPESGVDDETTEMVVIKADGKVWVYSGSSTPFEIEDKMCAFGAGNEAALAALYCGATAEQAVEIASMINITCGNGIDVLPLVSKEERH